MKRKPRLRIRGVMATVGPVKKGDKTYNITEEELKKAAASMIGKPIQRGHRGRPIGEVEKAWFENGKLLVKALVYEPENEEEEEFVRKIENGEIRGLSPSFTYENALPNVVLHGSLEIVGKKPDGTLIVKGVIPKEEIISKLGSMENLKNYAFTNSWIHDGTQKTKSKIEDEISKKKKTKID